MPPHSPNLYKNGLEKQQPITDSKNKPERRQGSDFQIILFKMFSIQQKVTRHTKK
jgi:hypothetical protein